MKMSAFPLSVAGFPNFATTQLLMSAAGGMNLQTTPSITSPKELSNISPTTMVGLAGGRIPGLHEGLSMAAAVHPSAGGYPQFANMSPTAMMDPRLLIPALGGSYDMKENADALIAWRQLAAAQAASAGALSYDAHAAAMAAASFSYPSYPPMDLNGARRKNATRETTSTLKAWLFEHRKNPYPTKGEKIMLAIITKMTLTQVSTWFANARRRLKKENKMTWSPRNRTDDGSSIDDEDKPDNDDDTGMADDDDISIDLSDFETENNVSPQKQAASCNTARVSPQRENPPTPPTQSTVSSPKDTHSISRGSHKPRIWSIADVASKPASTPSVNAVHHQSNSVRHRPYHLPNPLSNPTAFRPFFDNSYRQFAGHQALEAVAALSNPLLACRPPSSALTRVPHVSLSAPESSVSSLNPTVRSSSSSSTNTTSANKTISKLENIAKRIQTQDRSSPSHSSSSRNSSEH